MQMTIEKRKRKESIVFGTSAGGYAAILFGVLAGVDVVHAFGPQTIIGKMNNEPEEYAMATKKLITYSNKKYWDLKSVLKENNNQKTKIIIHVGSQHKRDMYHAQRLSGFQNVEIRAYDTQAHNIAKYLRDKDLLLDVLEHF